MTAPARRRPKKDRAPHGDPALFTPPSATTESKRNPAGFDFDRHIVDRVDWSIWRAIYNGDFRLAVRCKRCGRWLTDGRSKRRRHGARCASKAGVQ